MEVSEIRRSLFVVRQRFRESSEEQPFLPSDVMPGRADGRVLADRTYQEFCFAYQSEQHLKRHRKRRPAPKKSIS